MLQDFQLSRIDLNLLVLFEAVMRERNVARAALRLHLSASAVSHGLSRLRALLNDPLFVKTPRGVTPTERALALDAPVSEILTRVRAVVATAAPFDPKTARRSFVIGAADGASAVFLPRLMEQLEAASPGIDVRVRQLLPRAGGFTPQTAWSEAYAELDARVLDVAVLPFGAAPARFAARPFFEEDFVVAARVGHPFLARPDLEVYCAARHILVSSAADAFGFVDAALEALGRTRRVALTAPSFLLALAMLAHTDLICTVPRRLIALHGRRFELCCAEPPLALPRFGMHIATPAAALQDAGLTWFVEELARTCGQAGRDRA